MVSPSVIIMVTLVVIKAKSRSNSLRKKESTFIEHLLAAMLGTYTLCG